MFPELRYETTPQPIIPITETVDFGQQELSQPEAKIGERTGT